jgi:hypothetical protein
LSTFSYSSASHALGREADRDVGPALGPVDLVDGEQLGGHVRLVLAEPAGATVRHHLRGGTLGKGEDGRAAGQRLQHDQPERLGPADGEKGGFGVGQEPQLLLVGHLAEVLDPVAQERLDLSLEVRGLPRLAHLAGEKDGNARLPGGDDGPVGALLGHHATEEHAVVALAGADREVIDVDSVVDDAGDGQAGIGLELDVGDGDERDPVRDAPVEVDQLDVERSVDGGHDRDVRQRGRVGRADHRVVVDEVTVAHSLVGGEDVTELGHGEADPVPLRLLQQPLGRDGAGRVARGEQQDLVAGGHQAAAQAVDGLFDPAIEVGRDGGPRGGDDANLHFGI